MRILHCPENIAGQEWEYSQGLRELKIESSAFVFDRRFFAYNDHIWLKVSGGRFKPRWILFKNFLNMAKQYDVFHYHFGQTLLPRGRITRWGRLPRHLDLPVLKLLRKKMVMNYWGSDVRLAKIARAKNKYHDLTGLQDEDELKISNMNEVARYVDTAVVPCQEIYEYVHGFFRRVEIIPVAIDTNDITPRFSTHSNGVPLIIHSPTNRAIKGTKYILDAVNQLRKRHTFRFQLVEGVSNADVKKIFAEADIVVDQLLLGSYGTVSLEAMAVGKPVLCYIRDDLVQHEANLPVVNTNPGNICANLELLITNPAMRLELGKRGRDYVETYHDRRKVAKRLIDLYESL